MASSSTDRAVRDWQRIVATSLLGTERAGPAPLGVEGKPGELLALHQRGTTTAHRALLDAVAMLASYQRAGRCFPAASGETPVSAAESDRPECSPRAGRYLARILAARDGELLAEWSRAASEAGFRAPDESLPDLLDHLVNVRSRAARAEILTVTGERGRWLAGLNAAWRGLVAPAGDPRETWQTGMREQRLALVNELRQTQPAVARELLAGTWAEETPEDRAAFVEAMAVGLGPDDESFLEEVLDDSRKPVRTAAADLLARLPGSALCLRMRDRVLPLLKFTPAQTGLLKRKAASMEVTLPEGCDKATTRDGVDAKSKSSMGQKASMLCQILAATPLTAFRDEWQVPPAEIIATAVDCEFHDALLQGWGMAAARQSDAEWAEAFVGSRCYRNLGGQILPVWHDLMTDLLRILPAARRETLLAEVLGSKPFPLHQHPVIQWLAAHEPPWTVLFGRLVLNTVREHFARHSDGYDWELRRVVSSDIARRMPPSMAEEAATGWPSEGKAWNQGCADMVETLVSTLQLRRDFLKEFGS